MTIMRRRRTRGRKRGRSNERHYIFCGEREVRGSLGSQADPALLPRKGRLETR